MRAHDNAARPPALARGRTPPDRTRAPVTAPARLPTLRPPMRDWTRRDVVARRCFPLWLLLAVLAAVGPRHASAQPAPTTARLYLSGTGNDHTVLWEFRVSGGRRAGRWDTIPVPSNWEMQGFGTYHYFDDWSRDPAPDSVGEYRHRFPVPAAWRGRRVFLVVGAAMTDATMRVNGRLAGPTHRGGFYEFRYDVTELLRFGASDNLLEVRVGKFSSDSSVNRAERHADFWLFGGIFRPVWLEAVPAAYVAHVAIDARHTGAFAADVDVAGVPAPGRVEARIEQLDGAPVGAPFAVAVPAGTGRVRLHAQVPNVRPWSAEWPTRYRVRLRLVAGGAVRHEVVQTFGFRTVEVRLHDGVYVNGALVRLRGSNRHSFWPTTGRTTNAALSVADVQLMKDMNMNAVRMSHYPPDAHFLDACDSLGLFVIDELTGWQQAYSTAAGRPLVREMVDRDVNHPSILFWSNGNEGGFNTELDGDYARYDPQARTVIHPWQNFNGINTSHYEHYNCCAGWFFDGDDLIMPTEFLHGLYDGGAGAGLEDWWNRLVAHPLGVGGFLWSFADEGIVRADQGGRVDVNGNSAPDGVVGPYREREGSSYAIREIWSPVYLPWSTQDRLPATFTGALRVENRYDATDLRDVRFTWELRDFAGPRAASVAPAASAVATHVVAARGAAVSPAVPPRGAGTLQLDLPADWRRHDALALTARDPHGRDVYTWTWMIAGPDSVAARVVARAAASPTTASPTAASPTAGAPGVTGELRGGVLTMRAGDVEVRIDSATGRLLELRRGDAHSALRNGPRPLDSSAVLTSFAAHADGADYVAASRYTGAMQRVTWRLLPTGWLRLDYAYRVPRDRPRDYLGVTFDYTEAQLAGMRWLGRGPYHVWKNRRRGVEFDVWEKAYNDTQTGLDWHYPEFKGFHANTYWATLETRGAPLTMVFGTPRLYLRVLTPSFPTGPGVDAGGARVAFPAGDLSFLHGIAPIGDKFHPAADAGPQGEPNLVPRNGGTYAATVWLWLGGDPGP
ncbi:MAG TPA: glycoside hydrolase family 2 TIM barrel-domain containing protein [Gemmatirosa sp.]